MGKLYTVDLSPTVPPQPLSPSPATQSILSLFLRNCHRFQLLLRNLLAKELLQGIVCGLPGWENSLLRCIREDFQVVFPEC